MVTFTADLDGITSEMLEGFFDGWDPSPTTEEHLSALRGGLATILAFDGETVVGFATASGDGVLFAYLSLVEVRRQYRGQGIGTELVRRLIDSLRPIYGVDACCDPKLASFYERFGMQRVAGMVLRDRDVLRAGVGS